MNLYDFTVKDREGKDISLKEYKGKVVVVVNTATGCGFTPQYAPLQKLYDELKDKGLEILDFPCNQFANQAPGSDEEIHRFCEGRYGITFPQFAKTDVLGDGAEPLFKWLSENTSFGGFKGSMGKMLAGAVRSMDPDYMNNGNVKWNFTKFVLDRDGNIAARFEPTDDIKDLKAKIGELLTDVR